MGCGAQSAPPCDAVLVSASALQIGGKFRIAPADCRSSGLTVQYLDSRWRQRRPIVVQFDQTKFSEDTQILLTHRRQPEPAGLYVPQGPAQADSSLK